MEIFSGKTRELALRLSWGKCQCSEECVLPVTEFHHKCANTKVNRKLFPLFLQSVFNCCPINHGCHMTKPLPRITSNEAGVFEEFLQSIVKGDQNG